ncbi:MAG: PAS domain-containing protein [Bacteroidota bacterium]
MGNLNQQRSPEIDFEYFINISPDLICILDSEHKVIRANQALLKRLKVSAADLAGSDGSWILPEREAQISEIYIEVLNGWFSLTSFPTQDHEGVTTGSVCIARDITAHMQAGESLKNSLSLISATLESIHNGILVVSPDGTVIKTNAKFAELWQMPAEIISSAKDSILLAYAVTQVSDPEAFMAKVSELYENPEAESLDLIYLKDGRIFERISKPIILGGNPEGRVWTFLDITKRRKAEEALMQEQDLMSALMDSIPDHVYFKDLTSRFFRNNKAHVESFGVNDPAFLKNKSDFDFFVKDVADRLFEDEQNIIRTGLPMHKEEQTIRNDKSINWYMATKMPLRNKNNEIIGTFGISRDITDRKKTEQELKLKNEQLFTANAEKDKFFSILAHDIRSPFNAFLGLTSIIAEDLPSLRLEEIQKIGLTMRNSAANLYRLLENLLEWSLLQRGLTTFQPVSFLLHPLVSESLVFALESAAKKEIELNCLIPEDLMVYADEKMVGGIIRNLSSNAVKFTPKGGKVTITAKQVPGQSVEISVSDNGIGMNSELLTNLFHLDINISRKGTDGEPSTGLGLIICKDFIEKNNGKLKVESEEGKGTSFFFTLPARAEPK